MAATTLPICHLINEYDVYVDTIIIKNKKIDERGKICTLNTHIHDPLTFLAWKL